MRQINVSLGQRSYPILIGPGLLGRADERLNALPVKRWAVVADETAASFYAGSLGLPVYAFPAGEGSKCLAVYESLCRRMLADGFTRADGIVALGGGSSMDVGKAVGVLVNYGGKITDYEGNHKVPGPIVPMIAIPTTAGTGSEVTPFAVITDTQRNYKLSVFSYEILPKYAVLDPELIMTAPASIAASCGVDALIHAMEAYVSRNATPFSDAMAEKAMELIGGNLRRFVANRQDEEAACAMMLGSNFAGISFAWARLGNVHAMSHPVSAYFNVPHGVANSILLPNVVEYNALADHGRYEVIYNYIREGNGPIENFTPDMLVEELRHLNEQLGIPATLSEVGVTADKIPAMAEDAMKSGNIPANPRQSTVKDIIKLYEKTM